MYYIYLSHVGSYYVSSYELSEEECYCEECEDYDILICAVDDPCTIESKLNEINYVDHTENLSNHEIACRLYNYLK